MINNRSNKELLTALSETVIGHTEAKKCIINALSRSAIRYHQKWVAQEHDDYLISPGKVLLIGDSGTGKTHIVERALHLVDMPLLKVDATRLTLTGAGEGAGIKSADLILMLQQVAYEYSIKKHNDGVHCTSLMAMDKTVLFIDEFDKLAWGANGESDLWNKRVQGAFLQIFENKEELAGVTIIFAGAFSEIERQKKSNKALGFNPAALTLKEQAQEGIEELIIKYGLIPELVGRISTIVRLDKFTREDYKNILVNTLIPKKLEELIYFNCADLNLYDHEIEEIVDKAIASDQGVRYLKRELDKLVLDIEFNYEDIEENHHLLLSNLLTTYREESV